METQAKTSMFTGLAVRITGNSVIPVDALETILAANGHTMDSLVHNARVRLEQEQNEADKLRQEAEEEALKATEEYEKVLRAAKTQLAEAQKVINDTKATAQVHAVSADNIRKALEFTNHS
ncbi:hypothetical protein C4561_05015 [candidate division WWE3 bacterium]|jgi:vacuolar-type H+-ATPase subunit H|uniref:Uncharacterized protein n=1 Tax=candidate division WWE3 bacterium TaxID=2053526 RepID=A0A3A4ZIJ0_UNCKA|nr:MAG: hypothetical protein C4561_05015 [candidate division WWE3 bacterium]